MDEQIGILSNFWWAVVANDYSISIFLGVSFIITVLKMWALINPSVRNDSILCLIQGWLYGIPGIKHDDKGPIAPETKSQ